MSTKPNEIKTIEGRQIAGLLTLVVSIISITTSIALEKNEPIETPSPIEILNVVSLACVFMLFLGGSICANIIMIVNMKSIEFHITSLYALGLYVICAALLSDGLKLQVNWYTIYIYVGIPAILLFDTVFPQQQKNKITTE